MPKESDAVKAAKAKILEGFQDFIQAQGYNVLQCSEECEEPHEPIPMMLADLVVFGHMIGFDEDDESYSIYPGIFGVTGSAMPPHAAKGIMMHVLDLMDD